MVRALEVLFLVVVDLRRRCVVVVGLLHRYVWRRWCVDVFLLLLLLLIIVVVVVVGLLLIVVVVDLTW